MFGLGIWELLVILAIILIVFGPKRLKNLGSDLGSAIKGFRSAIKEDEPDTGPKEKVIEGEAHRSSESTNAKTHSDSNV